MRSARAELYSVPRGPAGDVTDAIDRLKVEPRPAASEHLETPDNSYRITAAGYAIEYHLNEPEQIITILSIY